MQPNPPQTTESGSALHYPSTSRKYHRLAETRAYTTEHVNLLPKLASRKSDYKTPLKSCGLVHGQVTLAPMEAHQDPGNIWEASNHNTGVYLGWDLTGRLAQEAKFYLQFLKDSFRLSVLSLDSWRLSASTPHTRGPFRHQHQEHEQAYATFKLLL